MKKWLRYFARFALIVFGVLLAAWLCIYLYFINHKKEILQKTISMVSNSVRGTVEIKDIGLDFPSTFPFVSVSLEGVSIRDSLYGTHHHELLKAEKVLLSTNPFKLITGKLVISKLVIANGNIFLYEDSTGLKSLDAFKSSKQSTEKRSLQSTVRAFKFQQVKFTLSKPSKKNLFSFNIRSATCKIAGSGEDTKLKCKADLFVGNIAFNLEKGSYVEKKRLTGNFLMNLDEVTKTLSFDNVTLNIDNEPYHFSGDFNFQGDRAYQLHIINPKTKFSKAAALLPINIRKNIDSIVFSKTLPVDAHIYGYLKPGVKPVVRVNWKVQNTDITLPSGTFTGASFTGFFYNAVYDSLPAIGENSLIQLNSVSANFEGIELVSNKVSVLNLKYPNLYCDLEASTNMRTLNDLLASQSIELTAGTLTAHVFYGGPIFDSATHSPRIYGAAKIAHAAMLYGPRQIRLEEFNGDLEFRGTDVNFNNVKAIAQGNTVLLKVEGKKLLALMNSDPAKAQLNASVYSPSINIGNFTSFIGSRRKTSGQRRKGSIFNKLAFKIDALLDQCSINSTIDADQIVFRKFNATNFKSNIFLSDEIWAIRNASLNHAGGTIALNGYLKGGSQNYNPVKIDASMDNLDIAKTFGAFNNFGLTSLSAKNLEGKLSSTIKLTGALQDKADLVPATLKGSVQLSLKKGGIHNWEPLESMSVFLLKNRDFSHVSFDEIKNTFEFDGQLININRMEIQSSVLSLFMEGLYDIAGKATDLVMQIPLSNLKKRKPDYVPENKGIDKNPGASVYVIAKNKDNGDIDFSFSLFKKKIDRKTAKAN